LEKQNQKPSSDIESLREFNKYLQRKEKDPSVEVNDGYWEDKWETVREVSFPIR